MLPSKIHQHVYSVQLGKWQHLQVQQRVRTANLAVILMWVAVSASSVPQDLKPRMQEQMHVHTAVRAQALKPQVLLCVKCAQQGPTQLLQASRQAERDFVEQMLVNLQTTE